MLPTRCTSCTLPRGHQAYIAPDTWHLHECPKGKIHLHNAIVREFAQLAAFAGATVRIEDRADDRGKRPDVSLSEIGPKQILLDVTIWSVASKTHVKQAARVAGHVARAAAKSKTAVYAKRGGPRGQRLDTSDTEFIPVVLESSGRLGDEALKLIDRLVTIACNGSEHLRKDQLVSYWLRRISAVFHDQSGRLARARARELVMSHSAHAALAAGGGRFVSVHTFDS